MGSDVITRRQCVAARWILQMTTEQFAEASGVSVTAISRFERNESDIMASTARRIEDAFKRKGIAFVESDGRRGIFYSAELDAKDAQELEMKRKRS